MDGWQQQPLLPQPAQQQQRHPHTGVRSTKKKPWPRCGVYAHRPTVCRMFGFAGVSHRRGDAVGRPRLSACKHMPRAAAAAALAESGAARRAARRARDGGALAETLRRCWHAAVMCMPRATRALAFRAHVHSDGTCVFILFSETFQTNSPGNFLETFPGNLPETSQRAPRPACSSYL